MYLDVLGAPLVSRFVKRDLLRKEGVDGVCGVKNERECGESRGSGYKADVRCRSPTQALSCALNACPLAKREIRTIGDENKNMFGMVPFVCRVEETRRELNEVWRVNLELPTLAALLISHTQILCKGSETKRDRAPDSTAGIHSSTRCPVLRLNPFHSASWKILQPAVSTVTCIDYYLRYLFQTHT